MNTKGNFSFRGRYTLRGINDTWYIYDRDLQTTKGRAGNTFKQAERNLLLFKKQTGDLI